MGLFKFTLKTFPNYQHFMYKFDCLILRLLYVLWHRLVDNRNVVKYLFLNGIPVTYYSS